MADAQRSQYVTPNKVIGSLTYRFGHDESKIMRGTTISVFYSGYSPYGNSFTYSNDMNGDGVNADLIYIPKAKGDIQFVSAEDENAFFKFLEQDDYLSKHKGEYAEANAARAPWVHKFDLRILEDFSLKVGKTAHTIQLSADVLNVGNLINSKWGVNKNMAASNYGAILKLEEVNANVPSYSMVKVGGEYPTKTYSTYENYSQCWQLQVGVRYFF